MCQRWKRTREKPTSATRAVRQSSLGELWTAFVHRWNTEPSFAELVTLHEEQRRRYGLAATRERVCELSWTADCPSCFVYWQKSCYHCERHGIARPDRVQWTNILCDCPLSERARTWIRRQERVCDDHERAHEWTRTNADVRQYFTFFPRTRSPTTKFPALRFAWPAIPPISQAVRSSRYRSPPGCSRARCSERPREVLREAPINRYS